MRFFKVQIAICYWQEVGKAYNQPLPAETNTISFSTADHLQLSNRLKSETQDKSFEVWQPMQQDRIGILFCKNLDDGDGSE